MKRYMFALTLLFVFKVNGNAFGPTDFALDRYEEAQRRKYSASSSSSIPRREAPIVYAMEHPTDSSFSRAHRAFQMRQYSDFYSEITEKISALLKLTSQALYLLSGVKNDAFRLYAHDKTKVDNARAQLRSLIQAGYKVKQLVPAVSVDSTSSADMQDHERVFQQILSELYAVPKDKQEATIQLILDYLDLEWSRFNLKHDTYQRSLPLLRRLQLWWQS